MIKRNYLATFAKSFNWAGFFLPKDTYEECSKLYAFCRILDDIVDSGQDLEIKKERFNEDPLPPDTTYDCPVCTRYNRSYIRHLYLAYTKQVTDFWHLQ